MQSSPLAPNMPHALCCIHLKTNAQNLDLRTRNALTRQNIHITLAVCASLKTAGTHSMTSHLRGKGATTRAAPGIVQPTPSACPNTECTRTPSLCTCHSTCLFIDYTPAISHYTPATNHYTPATNHYHALIITITITMPY